MRTTLTLDSELVRRLEELARRRRQSFKQTLNQVVRRGLATPPRPAEAPRYAVEPHRGGFRPGVDPGKLTQLADELEVERIG